MTSPIRPAAMNVFGDLHRKLEECDVAPPPRSADDDDLLNFLHTNTMAPAPVLTLPPRQGGAGAPPLPPPPPRFVARQLESFHVLRFRAASSLPVEMLAVRYAMHRSQDAYELLHVSIDRAWRAAEPQPTRARDHRFLRWMIGTLEADWRATTRLPACLHPALLTCLHELFFASTLACADARGYGDNQLYVRTMEIVDNRKRLVDGPRPADYPRQAGTIGSDQWIRTGARAIREFGETECFGFAILAADILIRNVGQGLVRVRTNGFHNYVQFDPPGGHPIIVDLWLGSVGHPFLYFAAGYPFALGDKPDVYTRPIVPRARL